MRPDDYLQAMRQLYSYRKVEVDRGDYQEFEKKLGFLERLAEVENSSVSVLDLNLQKYIFMQSRYIDKFGYSSFDPATSEPFYYACLIHPEDLPIVFDSYKQTFDFILDIPVSERKDYKLIQNFRQRDVSGKYQNIIIQMIILELDRNGNIWLILIIDDLLPDKIKFERVNRRFINIRTGKTFLFTHENEKAKRKILSSREIEVLSLVSKGFVSKEIADKLYLSVNTVNNHRQKILEKTKTTNTFEAVNYARNLGLI